MADTNAAMESPTKDIFPFFQLSRELRDKIYHAINSSSTTEIDLKSRLPYYQGSTTIFHCQPRLAPFLISRQFADEFTTESRRNLALDFVFENERGRDRMPICFATALLQRRDPMQLLKHVKQCTVAFKVATVLQSVRVGKDEYPAFLIGQLLGLLREMPELRVLKLEIMYGTRTSRELLGPNAWAYFRTDQSSLLFMSGLLDVTSHDLGFNGELTICRFLAMAVHAQGGDPQPPRTYPSHVTLGIREYKLYVSSVCYRVTRSKDPEAWLGVDMEVMGRAGDDDEFMAERGTELMCPITAVDYEKEMQEDPEQLRVAASYGGWY